MLAIASTVTMALPRLPQDAIYFRAAEVNWHKWEARITFIVYTLSFAFILIMRDAGILMLSKCAIVQLDEAFVIPVIGLITALGIIYLSLLELYLRCWPKLMVLSNTETLSSIEVN